MSSNRKSPGDGQKGDGRTDSKPDGDPCSSRVDVTTDEYGSTRAEVESAGPVLGVLEFAESVDEDSEISVTGYAFDDEDPHVECTVQIGPATVIFSFPTERAQGLAEELTLAAEAANQGGDI